MPYVLAAPHDQPVAKTTPSRTSTESKASAFLLPLLLLTCVSDAYIEPYAYASVSAAYTLPYSLNASVSDAYTLPYSQYIQYVSEAADSQNISDAAEFSFSHFQNINFSYPIEFF